MKKKNVKKNEKLKFIIIIFVGLISYAVSSIISKSVFQNIQTKPQQIPTQEIDSIYTDLNEKLNKFESVDELQDNIKLKDNEITEVSVPMGFFMQATLVKEFCESTGYIPEKYIATINSYNKNIDFDEQWIKVFTKAGADKNQALYSLKKQKELIATLFNDYVEKDYKNVLQTNSSFTKQDYCKLFDDYAEEGISAKVNQIKEVAPNTYKKYFEK